MDMDATMIFHGLAVKRHARPEDVARLICRPHAKVASQLNEAVKSGRVVEISGAYTLGPLARVALEADYSRIYADIRRNDVFLAAYNSFEHVNIELKSLITDWQSVNVGGRIVANDHSDEAYDMAIIDKLGGIHDRVEVILTKLSEAIPRFTFYTAALTQALERAEAGEIEWVSDVKIESYHTVWFELHEDLLRVTGNQRAE